MSPKTLIIAEAGVNHNGDLDLAKRLVDVASDAGADCVKFQTFRADNLVSKQAPKAEYQLETTDDSESQYEMIRRLELTRDDHLALIEYCSQRDITFLSTPFDIESADMLAELGIGCFKIPSGEITNLPLLRHISGLGIPIILSTGMSHLDEVQAAVDVLVKGGADRSEITVLHCNTEYPTPMADVHLNAMATLRNALGLAVGYSDHTPGIEVPIAAVALGAVVIEKHITLDRTLPGPDHRASLEPNELTAMVSAIRNIEVAMGGTEKRPSPSEIKNLTVARKSIVAARHIEAGEKFTADNLTVKRPGSGMSPMRWDEIIGTRADRALEPDEPL